MEKQVAAWAGLVQQVVQQYVAARANQAPPSGQDASVATGIAADVPPEAVGVTAAINAAGGATAVDARQSRQPYPRWSR